MVVHVCETCKDPFYTKSELNSHQKKKKKCEPSETSTKVLPPCICKCKKEFPSPEKLKKHGKNCFMNKKNAIVAHSDTNDIDSISKSIISGNNLIDIDNSINNVEDPKYDMDNSIDDISHLFDSTIESTDNISESDNTVLIIPDNIMKIDKSKNIVNIDNNLFQYNGYIFTSFCIINKSGKLNIWINSTEIITYLKYENANNAICNHVNNEDKMCYNNLLKKLGPIKKMPSGKISGSTNFINLHGFIDLIRHARQNKDTHIKKWLKKEILPLLHEYDSKHKNKTLKI